MFFSRRKAPAWELAIHAHINHLEHRMSAKFDELKASVEAYIAASQDAIASANTNVQTAIDNAVAAHDAGEEDAFGTLKDEVDAAFGTIGAVPTPTVTTTDQVVAAGEPTPA